MPSYAGQAPRRQRSNPRPPPPSHAHATRQTFIVITPLSSNRVRGVGNTGSLRIGSLLQGVRRKTIWCSELFLRVLKSKKLPLNFKMPSVCKQKTKSSLSIYLEDKSSSRGKGKKTLRFSPGTDLRAPMLSVLIWVLFHVENPWAQTKSAGAEH